MLSVVFPAYNEEDNVEELHRRLVLALEGVGEPYEIIAVNNASTDATRDKLLKLSPLTLISLGYNLGQTAALDAGIHHAKGDTVITIDADLQNDPQDIPRLINKMKEGYDVVVGWRHIRRDNLMRRWFSKFSNKVTAKISGLKIHDYGCALRAFKKKDLEDIRLYGVMHVFIPVILAGRGARIAEIKVNHAERKSGVTKYSLTKIATDIADLLTIKFLYSYAKRPLVFFGTGALASFGVAFIAIVWSIIIKFQGKLGFSQTPLVVIGTLFIILGFLLFMMGFMTELMLRIYYESRRETPYKITEIKEIK